MSQEEMLQPIINRAVFYRDNYRVMVIVLMISVLLNASLAALVVVAFFDQQPPPFIVTTTDGQLIPIGAKRYR